MLAHQMVRGASLLVNKLHADLTLRSVAACQGDVRLIGRPIIASSGSITLGRRVTLLSEPSPVRITVAAGAVLAIEEGAVIGSGTTIVTRARVHIGAGAELGEGCIVSDAEEAAGEGPAPIEIGAGARL